MTCASHGTMGARKKFISFCSAVIVRSAQVYAPTAMNPAWPSEKSPVNPFTRFSESASTT